MVPFGKHDHYSTSGGGWTTSVNTDSYAMQLKSRAMEEAMIILEDKMRLLENKNQQAQLSPINLYGMVNPITGMTINNNSHISPEPDCSYSHNELEGRCTPAGNCWDHRNHGEKTEAQKKILRYRIKFREKNGNKLPIHQNCPHCMEEIIKS